MKMRKNLLWAGTMFFLLISITFFSNRAKAAETIDLTPKDGAIASGASGSGWSYGQTEISGFGTTEGLNLTSGEFILTGTNTHCMIKIGVDVKKVTLQDCTIQPEDTYPAILINNTKGLELVIKGNNQLSTTQDKDYSLSSCGIFGMPYSEYTFSGNGTLNINASNAIGIYDGNITVDGATLNVYGEYGGISTTGRFVMNGGNVKLTTPTSSSTGVTYHSYGLQANSSVVINGGKLTISSGYIGISSTTFINISGGTTDITVDTHKEEGFAGMEASGSITISDGKVTITTPAFKAIDCSTTDIAEGTLSTNYTDASGAGTINSSDLVAPTSIKIKNLSYSSCKLTWDKISSAQYYDIRYSMYADGPWEYAGRAKTNSFKKDGLSPGNVYYFQIQSGASGYTPSDYSSTVKIKVLPAAPTKVKAKKKGSSLKISWKKIKKVSGYKIYISNKAGSGFKCVKTVTSGKAKKYTKKGIQRGKTYYVKIKSFYKTSSKTYKSKFSKVAHS